MQMILVSLNGFGNYRASNDNSLARQSSMRLSFLPGAKRPFPVARRMRPEISLRQIVKFHQFPEENECRKIQQLCVGAEARSGVSKIEFLDCRMRD